MKTLQEYDKTGWCKKNFELFSKNYREMDINSKINLKSNLTGDIFDAVRISAGLPTFIKTISDRPNKRAKQQKIHF